MTATVVNLRVSKLSCYGTGATNNFEMSTAAWSLFYVDLDSVPESLVCFAALIKEDSVLIRRKKSTDFLQPVEETCCCPANLEGIVITLESESWSLVEKVIEVVQSTGVVKGDGAVGARLRRIYILLRSDWVLWA